MRPTMTHKTTVEAGAEERAATLFSDFAIEPRCLRVLERQGLTTPTPVQAKAIPVALEGKDIVATAQTGTGKTLAFTLPSLTRLARRPPHPNRMLVLVPTRELAVQVESVTRKLGEALGMRTALIYGGAGMGKQIDQLKRGSDIIVATPGRLLDHMGAGRVKFDALEILVFDEADRMLDMGFLPDIRRILEKLPRKRQTLMFSATFAPALQSLTLNMMHQPVRIAIGALAKPVDTVRQLLIPVRQEEKSKWLLQLLKEEDITPAIVFLRTKMRTDRVGQTLKKAGYKAAVIHGDLPQNARQRALEGFRQGRFDLLVATDVAARGLDINDISHVINYDIPENPDDYVHRIGRTARAQKEGDAITFVTPGDMAALAAIEKTIGKPIPRREYEGAPPVLSVFKPQGVVRSTGARRVVKRGMGRRR
jgi:ATP-dependent RNA helicase RhlE